MVMLSAMQFFSEELLQWYHEQKRDLPWRHSRDPYHIWVSEVMLQQTRVDTAIPYYEQFLKRFPTVMALATAPEQEVLKSWEGLGYYSRARNLHMAAREVCERYGGTIPDTKEAFGSLQGVGPYTTGAVMSIAFNQREPAVDGNVMRVLSRYFCLEDDIAKNGTRVKMERLQWELIPDGVASDFNQALMELGALICTPKSPQCLICPVMEHCAGRLAGKEERLPVKTKGKPPRPEVRACAFVLNPDGTHILLRQRPSTGLLANMWELPHVELNGELDEITDVTWSASLSDYELGVLMEHWVSRVVGAPIEYQNTLGKIEHVFSHIHWHLRVFQLRMTVEIEQVTHMPYQWVNRDGLEQYPMPNVFTRILKQQSN